MEELIKKTLKCSYDEFRCEKGISSYLRLISKDAKTLNQIGFLQIHYRFEDSNQDVLATKKDDHILIDVKLYKVNFDKLEKMCRRNE